MNRSGPSGINRLLEMGIVKGKHFIIENDDETLIRKACLRVCFGLWERTID